MEKANSSYSCPTKWENKNESDYNKNYQVHTLSGMSITWNKTASCIRDVSFFQHFLHMLTLVQYKQNWTMFETEIWSTHVSKLRIEFSWWQFKLLLALCQLNINKQQLIDSLQNYSKLTALIQLHANMEQSANPLARLWTITRAIQAVT